jgi:pyruvate formate lyase activating enzyme
VLETLEYVARATSVWLEVTTLLIPGLNDSDGEVDALSRWLVEHLGPGVPLHFTAFHPDWKLLDRPPTPLRTLRRARTIALANGVFHVYTGNVHDPHGQSTWCDRCGALLIERDRYVLGRWRLTPDGCCESCGERCPGVFEERPGTWGPRRLPVRLA